MTKRNKKALIILFALVTALLIACPEVLAVKAVAPDGPYPVGVRVLHMEVGGREAPVMVWYPAQSPPGATPYLYNTDVQGVAVFDTPIEKEGAPLPLIIFSHGMWACGCQSVFYTENLASFGYVVVAPDHDDSLMCHIEGKPEITRARLAEKSSEMGYDFSYRPPEVKAVIDRTLHWNNDPDSFLYKTIDPDKIGMSGHSLGGYTTLMVGGVPIRCDQEPPGAEECDYGVGDLRRYVSPCCMESVQQEKDPFLMRDERVKAILPLGPAVYFPNLEQAGAELTIPLMIITGDSQWIEVPWEPIWTLYENAPPPKYVVRLKQTGHMAIADSNLTIPAARILFPGFRSHFEDKAQAYKDYSVAFFDLCLKGDDSRAATLKEPTSPFVELYFEAP
jgi:predicted dienelactone hydrolase